MPNPAASIQSIRFIYRFIYLSLLILGGILLAGLLRVIFGPGWMLRMPGRGIIQSWMRLCASSLGLKIHYEQSVSETSSGNVAVMFVANHISWLDIVVIGSLFQTSFVSKDDVRDWPLIGQLAALSGTQFLKRHSVSSLRRSIEHLQDVLEQGHNIAIFPEGTTSDGSTVLPFHGGLFKAAIAAGTPIQPLMLFYQRGNKRDHLAPFIGSTTFLEHIVSIMWLDETHVIIKPTAWIMPDTSSVMLADQCRDLIQQQHTPLLDAANHG